MASNKNKKKGQSNKAKDVLASPFELGWSSILTPNSLDEIRDILVTCSMDMKSPMKELRPNWMQLQKIADKTLRKQAIQEFVENHLQGLTKEERAKLEETHERVIDKWSHVCVGFNEVMRRVRRDEIAVVFVNASCTSDVLTKSFIPICHLKNIPLIPVNDLEDIFRKTIAIGLKNSVKFESNCFHPIYKKVISVLGADLYSQIFSTESDCVDMKVNQNEDCKKLNKEAALAIDTDLYHLRRNHTNQRVYIPNKGVNQLALKDDLEFISLPKDIPELSANAGQKFTYGRRSYGGKKYSNVGTSVEDISSSANARFSAPEVDVGALASESLFELDFVSDDSSAPLDQVSVDKIAPLKRTTSETKKAVASKRSKPSETAELSYLPASVLKIIPKPNKKVLKLAVKRSVKKV